MSTHRSKVIVSLLAAVLGVFGAHWWYLHRRGAWLFTLVTVGLLAFAFSRPVWWDTPAFLLLFIPAAAGYIEALIFCLKPDSWFDQRYNNGVSITQTGWGPVVIAILTTLFGATVVMFGLAMTVIHVYEQLGWLDGYTY